MRMKPCQIELVERKGERPYLKYTEDVSKNRPGGLKGRKQKQKVVVHHANLENPERCFVRLFKLYCQLSPSSVYAFYLKPLRSPTLTCWYSTDPLGHMSLGKTVAHLCKEAGIGGYRTNHSLRATTATRLYQSGVDEQVVMERTGHRSLEGVRSYKRTSDSQREAVSDILNRKKPCLENTAVDCQSSSGSAIQAQNTANAHSIETTVKNTIPGGIYFSSCSSVAVNIHVNSSN